MIKEVKKIAKLARIEISEKEAEKFQEEFSSILDYFKLLEELKTSEIEPVFQPTEFFLKKEGKIMREDKEVSQKKEIVEKLLELAPEKKDRYFKVKTVL